MADTTENKKYLVNVESNLDKYAADAAKAAEEVDKLTAENNELRKSTTASQEEIERSNAALRNAKKEYTDAKKLVDLQTQANNANVNSRKQLAAIVALEQRRLGELSNTYSINSKGVRVLSQDYINQVKRLKEAKEAVIEYDKAQLDGRSSIGLYSEAIQGATANVAAMINPMALVAAGVALVTKVLGGIKDALLDTTRAMDAMNIVGLVTKQMFYDLATSGKISIDAMYEAAKTAQFMNEVRKGNRQDLVEFALLEREIAKIEFDAADKTKTRAEREEALNLAIAKQNELSDKKILDAREDLRISDENQRRQPQNEAYREQYAKDLARIIDLDRERFEQTKRNQSRVTQFQQQETEERRKLFDAWNKEIDEQNKAYEEQKLKIAETLKKTKEQNLKDLAPSVELADAQLQRIMKVKDYKIDELQFNKDIAEQNARLTDEAIARDQRETDAYLYNIELKRQGAIEGLAALSSIVGEQTEAGKVFAMAAATIDTYGAANKALNDPTIPSTIARIAIMTAIILKGIANVKSIASVKVGKGTTTSAPSTSSIPNIRSFASPANIFTQPQLSQGQLNSVANQPLITADDIANALKNMPPPIVTVEDINAKALTKSRVEVRANI